MSIDEITFDYDEQLAETDKAFLFEVDGENVWIPKSEIIDHNEEKEQVTIPMWLAREKGLD